MRARLLTALFTPTLLLLGLAMLATPAAYAQTPDGETPAIEDACDGFTGKVYGLCNAYCEAMDCDADTPQASDMACTRVFDKIVAANDGPFPFCGDQDGDGVPNGRAFPPRIGELPVPFRRSS